MARRASDGAPRARRRRAFEASGTDATVRPRVPSASRRRTVSPHPPAKGEAPERRSARSIGYADAQTDVAEGAEAPKAAMCVQGVDDRCVLQFTSLHAVGCARHRRESRVIHRSELSLLLKPSIDDQHTIAGVCETRRHVRSVRATGAPSRSRGVGLSTREPSAKGRPRERDRPSAWKPTVRRSPARETPRAGSPAPGHLPTRDHETARPRDHETTRPRDVASGPMVPWSHGPAEISRRRAPAVDASRKPKADRKSRVSRNSHHSQSAAGDASTAGWGNDNDPSAGSPTETLLRLLLSLNDRVRTSSEA